MRKILLSLLVIGLVAGLAGAALADFSDIETSVGNSFATGKLNLLVSDGETGVLYEDPDVPVLFNIVDAWPECENKIAYFDLTNEGAGDQFIPWVYLHIKNLACEGIEKVEPELAAETGATPVGENAEGKQIYATDTMEAGGVAALGEFGENCELSKHVDITIWTARVSQNGTAMGVDEADWVMLNLDEYDTDPQDGKVKLNEAYCHQIEIGELANTPEQAPGNVIYVKVMLRLQDVDEDDLIAQGVLVDPGTGFGWFDATNPHEAKWDHWPTNALMMDKVTFDMAFELLQFQGGNPPDPTQTPT